MILVEIKTSGLDLESAAEKISGPAKAKFVARIADVLYGTMRELAPLKTGFLRDSIVKYVENDEAAVGPLASYASFVEFGTKPHMIFTAGASCLSFVANGVRVFTKYVFHPGTRPQPFVKYAVQEAERQGPEIWTKTCEEIVK